MKMAHPARAERSDPSALCMFRAAMTLPMVSTLSQLLNTHIETAFGERSRGMEEYATQM